MNYSTTVRGKSITYEKDRKGGTTEEKLEETKWERKRRMMIHICIYA